MRGCGRDLSDGSGFLGFFATFDKLFSATDRCWRSGADEMLSRDAFWRGMGVLFGSQR